MLTKPVFISRWLWQALRAAPGPCWKRGRPLRYDSGALLMAFVLSSLALASGLVLSMLIVSRAVGLIARDYENATFEVLAVTPPGGLGASWARFTSFIHDELTLKTLNRLRYSALATVLLVGLFTTATLLLPALRQGDGAALAEAGQWGLFTGFIVALMALDYRYAVISGGLISVLAPAIHSPDARLTAIVSAVALHLSGYLVAALTGALILPTIYTTLGVQGWFADLSRWLVTLVMFALIHETAVLLLYRAAQERLNGFDFGPPVRTSRRLQSS